MMTGKKGAVDHGRLIPSSTVALLSQSLTVIFTNMIPLYNVWHYGWSSFNLILLFIVEGVIVFLTDLIKRVFKPEDKQNGVLFFEFVFISGFGFFAILLFGRDPGSPDLLATIRSSFQSAKVIQLWPVIGILLMRLFRTGQELQQSGAFGNGSRQPLIYGGGGWMFLLFCLVMTAPWIADKSPNPMAGLIAVVVFKTLGEVIALLAPRITK
ncbi:MAG: DUF6498-containing protein [bacterium]